MVTHLQKEENALRKDRMLLDMGHPPPRMRRRYRILNDRLAQFVDEYDHGEISLKEYIRKVACTVPEFDR